MRLPKDPPARDGVGAGSGSARLSEAIPSKEEQGRLISRKQSAAVEFDSDSCTTEPVHKEPGPMRKALQRALRDHLQPDGQITGYMVVTFRDGVATITSDASDNDEAAQEVLETIALAILDPASPAEDASDEIGICAGNA